MKEITLKLSVEEANHILQSLGNQPYVQVHQLIQKIQFQAGTQLQEESKGNGSEKSAKKELEAITG